jgi:hypothetical protein
MTKIQKNQVSTWWLIWLRQAQPPCRSQLNHWLYYGNNLLIFRFGVYFLGFVCNLKI